ncbi:MAG: tripartite tricarboxylate transporter permease, partial [Xanthobacteraceae bacterium]
ISILLPITYGMEPATAIIMIAGIYYGAQYGGTITSVLLNLPGESTTVVTTFDGYQMARQGRAGPALAIAAIGSFIGGTISILGLSFVAPVVAGFALDFGPPEYAALALLGILLVSTLGTGSTVKCLVAACVGLLFATVGQDNFVSGERFTFGSLALVDGIDFVPLAMGLFGLGEILYDLERRARQSLTMPGVGRAWIGKLDWVKSRAAIARGTVIGFFIGVLPGGGATLASLISYATEKRTAKKPQEFGRGAIAGVAGPETANNAAATSSFIPLLTLGIPANATMAVLYGALLLQGIPPGPRLINEHPDVFWGFVASMYVGNLMLLALNLPLVSLFVSVLRIPYAYLYPLIIMFCVIGVYEVNHSIVDVWIMLIMGVVGYGLKKFGFDPAPLVLGLVIAPIFEMSLRQSLIMSDGHWEIFVERPIAAVLLTASAGLLTLAAIGLFTRRKDWRRKLAEAEASEGK